MGGFSKFYADFGLIFINSSSVSRKDLTRRKKWAMGCLEGGKKEETVSGK